MLQLLTRVFQDLNSLLWSTKKSSKATFKQTKKSIKLWSRCLLDAAVTVTKEAVLLTLIINNLLVGISLNMLWSTINA